MAGTSEFSQQPFYQEICSSSSETIDTWKKSIREYFNSGKPEWVLYQNGTLVWIPTDTVMQSNNIVDYSRRLVRDENYHNCECHVNEHSNGVFFVRHGQDCYHLWTIIYIQELSDMIRNRLYCKRGNLTSEGVEILKSVARTKMILDAANLVTLEEQRR
jgi:hypothetical protein